MFGERKNYDMNSNTYHPGLRNHPNFRYGNSSNQLNPNFQANAQGGGQGGQSYQNRQGNYQRNYNGNNQGFGNRENYSRGYNQGGSSNSQGGGESHVTELTRSLEIMGKTQEAILRQMAQLADEVARVKGVPEKPSNEASTSKNAHVNVVSLAEQWENVGKDTTSSSPIVGDKNEVVKEWEQQEASQTNLSLIHI